MTTPEIVLAILCGLMFMGAIAVVAVAMIRETTRRRDDDPLDDDSQNFGA